MALLTYTPEFLTVRDYPARNELTELAGLLSFGRPAWESGLQPALENLNLGRLSTIPGQERVAHCVPTVQPDVTTPRFASGSLEFCSKCVPGSHRQCHQLPGKAPGPEAVTPWEDISQLSQLVAEEMKHALGDCAVRNHLATNWRLASLGLTPRVYSLFCRCFVCTCCDKSQL